jgi:hypothetical protein
MHALVEACKDITCQSLLCPQDRERKKHTHTHTLDAWYDSVVDEQPTRLLTTHTLRASPEMLNM